MTTLYDWYRANHRRLPWRDTRDPYRVWVSEVMLQQTRVETVLGYYDRFVARYPDVATLAAAPLEEVLKVWEGLGYYARCRNLHRAAGIVVSRHGGSFPRSPEALASLPGVGRSTAGAIASIAFGVPAPVLDANVRRVLARLLDLRSDLSSPRNLGRLWKTASDLVLRAPDPGLHNQALMECGAMICTPDDPHCPDCPLNGRCRSRRRGTVDRIPAKRPPRVRPHLDIAVGVIVRPGGEVFVQRRPEHKMLGGLWEFPGGKVEPGESPEAAVRREVREELGVEVSVDREVTTVHHEYTHLRVTLHAFLCRIAQGEPSPCEAAAWTWTSVHDLSRYPFPRANQKVIAALAGLLPSPRDG